MPIVTHQHHLYRSASFKEKGCYFYSIQQINNKKKMAFLVCNGKCPPKKLYTIFKNGNTFHPVKKPEFEGLMV